MDHNNQRHSLASLLGASSGQLLLLAAALGSALFGVYALIALVRSKLSACEWRKCATCRGPNAAPDSRCARCGAPSGATRAQHSGYVGIAGLSQHPIIFGKSKDSILVPELASEHQHQHQQHQHQHQYQYQQQAQHPTQCERRHFGHQPSGELESDDQQLELAHPPPPATTRVLTDENGHSIKIRIASPPPQRQSQLAKLYQSCGGGGGGGGRKSAQEQQQQEQPATLAAAQSGSGDANQSQTKVSAWVEFEGDDEQATDVGQRRRRLSCGALSRHEQALGADGSKRRRPSHLAPANALTPQPNQTLAAPIEPFNDSNTSEFDDADAWDSRQDTSLDFQTGDGHAGADTPTRSAADQGGHGGGGGGGGGGRAVDALSADDSVMDADLRQTNRLNLELMLLQNAAQNLMDSMGTIPLEAQLSAGAGATGSGRARGSRSASLNGTSSTVCGAGVGRPSEPVASHQLPAAAAATATNSTGFPQSGVLVAASEFGQQRVVASAEQLVALHRQLSAGSGRRQSHNSASDQDSGISGASNSRKSSLVAAIAANVPSIRIRVRRLSATETSAESEQQQQPTLSSELGASGQRSRSILGLTLGSLGRPASQHQQHQQNVVELDPEFEISIVEARNLTKSQQVANNTQAADQQVASPGPNGRSESIFGALMAAATRAGNGSAAANNALGQQLSQSSWSPGAARRSSVDGIFIRVFKNQAAGGEQWVGAASGGGGGGGQSRCSASLSREHSNSADSVSLNSCTSLVSATNSSNQAAASAQVADFIQLPIIKLPLEQQNNCCSLSSSPANSVIKLSSLAAPIANAYKFTCRLSEFPLRVSVYQVSKRGGARYTLGHCFIAADDWQWRPKSDDGRQQQAPSADEPKRRRSSLDSATPACDEEQRAQRAQPAPRSTKVGEPSVGWPEVGAHALMMGARFRLIGGVRRKLSECEATGDWWWQATRTGDESGDECEPSGGLMLEYRLHQTILEATKW